MKLKATVNRLWYRLTGRYLFRRVMCGVSSDSDGGAIIHLSDGDQIHLGPVVKFDPRYPARPDAQQDQQPEDPDAQA